MTLYMPRNAKSTKPKDAAMTVSKEVEKILTDEDQIKLFDYYFLFRGDVLRLSMITGYDPRALEKVAKKFNWAEKIAARSGTPEPDSELGKQALRMTGLRQARLLQELINRISEEFLSDDELRSTLTMSMGEAGISTNFKPLADLVNSAETVQKMIARAVQDEPTRRGPKTDGGVESGEVMMAIIHALSEKNKQACTPAAIGARREAVIDVVDFMNPEDKREPVALNAKSDEETSEE